jgi:hypothetical protein
MHISDPVLLRIIFGNSSCDYYERPLQEVENVLGIFGVQSEARNDLPVQNRSERDGALQAQERVMFQGRFDLRGELGV